jgi:NADPH2:quinone reductase
MKALVCDKWELPSALKVGDLPKPSPGPKEVLIKIKACGVNFPDVLIVQGLYQFRPPFPFSPGGEISGEIEAVGEEVKHLKPGQEVVSMIGWGGMAEYVVANKNVVFPKPPGMPHTVASAFLMVFGTSYHALKDRAKLKEGETLLVLGASGGVGLAAVELGKLMGAKVIAAASTDEKLEICKNYGADEVINYSHENLKERIKELTEGKGADVTYDPVGGDYSEQALRATAWKGRFLVVGFAAGEIPKIPLNLALLKGCDIVGVFWGSFAQRNPNGLMQNTMQLIQWYQNGDIKPHIHGTYSLDEASNAIMALMNREVSGKVVIEIS